MNPHDRDLVEEVLEETRQLDLAGSSRPEFWGSLLQYLSPEPAGTTAEGFWGLEQAARDIRAVLESANIDMTALYAAVARTTQFPDAILAPMLVQHPGLENTVWRARIRSLEDQVRDLSEEIAKVRKVGTIVVPVTSFAPEPYTLIKPISVVVSPSDDEGFYASFYDANIHASGDTEEEAFRYLKDLMLDVFELLSAEPEETLGSLARSQLAVLKEHIQPSQR